MFGIGTTELLILLGIIVIFFGASKLPQLGSGLGQGIRNFKKSIKGDDDKAIDVTPNGEKSDEKSSEKIEEKNKS